MKYPEYVFTFKQLNGEILEEICRMQEIAFEHIDNTDILRKNSKEMLRSCLNAPHYTVGAFYENTLAGFAVLYEGGKTEENIGWDIGVDENEILMVLNVKLVIVHPDFRGNGLQIRLTDELERIAKQRGCKILCATVSPDNVYSKNNFEKMGYALHSCKEKYGGLKRNIYYKAI